MSLRSSLMKIYILLTSVISIEENSLFAYTIQTQAKTTFEEFFSSLRNSCLFSHTDTTEDQFLTIFLSP